MTYRTRMRVNCSDVMDAVATVTGVYIDELCSNATYPEIVRARDLYVAAMRTFTFASFPDIARSLNRANHGGVHRGMQRWLENPSAVLMARVCHALHGAQASLSIALPYPPSANRYWRAITVAGRARVVLSREAKAYREIVAETIDRHLDPLPFVKPVAVGLTAYAPDRRRRDLDNVPKVMLDALTHAEVWDDDALIDDLRIIRGPVEPDRPRVELAVSLLQEQ